MKVSKRRASFADRYLPTSKSFTSPAICDGNADASKRVMRAMPERAGEDRCPRPSATPMPTGRDDAQPGDDDACAGSW